MEEWGLYSRFFNLDRSMKMAKRPPLRQEHPYYMHDCIQDQPEAIAKILDSQGAAAEELAGLASGARRVYVCGIGTSWHAALVGEHLFRSVGLAEARAWHSFEFASYPPPLSGDDLVIVMAHSGDEALLGGGAGPGEGVGGFDGVGDLFDVGGQAGPGGRGAEDDVPGQILGVHDQSHGGDDRTGDDGIEGCGRRGVG